MRMGLWRAFRIAWWVGWPAAAVLYFLRGRRPADTTRVREANPPVPDEVLDTMRREIEEAVREAGAGAAGELLKAKLPDEVLAAFASRYTVEREVRALWERAFGEAPPRRGLELLIEPLVREGALSQEMAGAIEAVSRVASPAVHAQPISEAKVRFLREVAPGLAAALREVNEPRRASAAS